MVLPLKKFSSQKCRGEGTLAKNAVFGHFPCPPPPRQSQKIVTRTILMPDDFHMAHLNRYGPLLNDNIEKVAFV